MAVVVVLVLAEHDDGMLAGPASRDCDGGWRRRR